MYAPQVSLPFRAPFIHFFSFWRKHVLMCVCGGVRRQPPPPPPAPRGPQAIACCHSGAPFGLPRPCNRARPRLSGELGGGGVSVCTRLATSVCRLKT